MLDLLLWILPKLATVFEYRPQLLLCLAVAIFVLFRLRSSPWAQRQVAAMTTYLTLAFFALVIGASLDPSSSHRSTNGQFEFIVLALPSSVIAYGVLLLVELATWYGRELKLSAELNKSSDALNGKKDPWALPQRTVLMALGLAFVALLGGMMHVSSQQARPKTATKERHRFATELEPFTPQAMLDWSEIEAKTCGVTVAPQGLKVVTRYGLQAIPWGVVRQAEVSFDRPKLTVEVEKRQITLSSLEEPNVGAGQYVVDWQSVLSKIEELGLMQRTQDPRQNGRQVLLRAADAELPKMTASFHVPTPGGEQYRGLSVATLRTLNCQNGVTLCAEGVVVRDVCGIKSVAWEDVRGLLVDNVLQISCEEEERPIELLTSEMATLKLSGAHRAQLEQRLLEILGLKQTKNKASIPQSYTRSGGPLKPPVTPIFFPAQVAKSR